MTATPAFVLNGRLEILSETSWGLRCTHRSTPTRSGPPTLPGSSSWILTQPSSRQLSDLIGELSIRSAEFRIRWPAHDVRIHTTGVKLLHHPVVGDLELPFETFPQGADPSQSLLTYTAEPGSASHDALNLLASWAAPTGAPEQAPSTNNPREG